MKIGIFDSGIGGLSVLKEVAHYMDRYDIYYLADRLNAPYGNKTKQEVYSYCEAIVNEFLSIDIDTILIACNSATAMAIDELRSNFPQIRFFGIEPFINVINLRPELISKRGVCLTTQLTADSNRFKYLQQKYDANHTLEYRTSKMLAKLIEEAFDSGRLDTHKIEEEIKSSVFTKSTKDSFDYIILGCTHYPFVSEVFEKVLGTTSISPCAHVAKHMASCLVNKLDETQEIRDHFYFRDTSKAATKEQWRIVKKENLKGFPFF
ncbi:MULTISPECIES: glutamate racemase [unclassified Halobacteriovorax]|uniref:glutamate racemase n=1 Tax=unclassified Halobacteriovorax TaxID=2639665 RepID=UPI000EB701CF|nr:aspartate/glutamate racemase family protein [Halobacteriovorax sp. BALOs_7]AYF44653.1 putative glutamate racemase [Halobacteriovorax sp. BALOs_7]